MNGPQPNSIERTLGPLGPEIVERYAPESEPGPGRPAFADAAAEFHLTDLGNSERFVDEHGDRLRYCHAWGSWLVWDGKRWARDDSGEVYRLAAETVRGMYATAARLDDPDKRQRLAQHAARCEKRERMAAMVDMARNLEPVVVRVDDLDRDHCLLNCLNGVLDLRTGELLPHDPALLLTRLAPVEYGPNANAPTFERFLRRTFNDDADLMRFVRRAAGYSLTGDTGEQCLFIAHGTGANGKSTLLTVIQDLLGDYAATTPAETLLARRNGDGIPNDIARLQGVRFVAASETEDGRRLSESRVKAMTGGDRISARFMRAEWFEFEPQFKLWLGTNHKPEIKGTDAAIWRRIRLIPFNVTIPEDERDPKLLDKLRGELPGILAWAVRGCLDWQQRRLDPPAAVTAATEDYRAESDALGRFIEERCVVAEGFECKASGLYSEYKAWCAEGGETHITSTAFGRRMVERGLSKVRRPAGIVYEGVGVRAGM